MSGKNKSAYPFFIVAGTMVCLLALSRLDLDFSPGGTPLKRVDLLSEVRKSPGKPGNSGLPDTARLPAAVPDTLPGNIPNPDHFHDFMTYTGIMEYAAPQPGDTLREVKGMQHFLDALKALKTGKRKKVRIAYFGDSMIEGDLITGDLRDSLQTFFGGEGVGFMPLTSVVSTFRTTISHTFSRDWKDYHYKNNPPETVPLGLSGHTFLPGEESWVKFAPVRKPRLNRFSGISVLYGPTAASTLSINDKPYTLTGIRGVNRLDLRTDTAQQSLVFKYNGEKVPFYGVCFESDSGVYVDNYSFRGISGVELGKLSKNMIRNMQEERPYDLIVLHYGANVLFRPELTDYSWYERPMKKVMDSLRQDFPGTSFLIIGTADKAYRKSDRYVTAPGVTALLKVQHELAQQHGTGYWNLFAAMGGEGSMTRWVEGDTVLANKDYTHLNRQGAAKVGALLYKAIMNEYREEEHP